MAVALFQVNTLKKKTEEGSLQGGAQSNCRASERPNDKQ